MSNDYLYHRRNPGEKPPAGTAPAEDAFGVRGAEAVASANLTVFRCVNCSGPGVVPSSVIGSRLSRPGLERTIVVHEVAFPCTGKLQPEDLLRAFEAGADAVCVIDCAGDDCRYLEGRQRAERRAEYVGKLLDEIGLGSQRLMLFHLDGPGQRDPTLGEASPGPSPDARLNQEEARLRLAGICDTVAARLHALPPNPLRRDGSTVYLDRGPRRDGANGDRHKAS